MIQKLLSDGSICPKQLVVLLVEDDVQQRSLQRKILEGIGLQILECGSCADAESILRQVPIAIAVIDLALPDGEGTQIIRSIRQSYPAVRVLVCSANRSLETLQEAIELQVFAFVDKVNDLRSLVMLVEQATVDFLRNALSVSQFESRLQVRLLDAIDEAAIAVDTSFRILYMNQFAKKLFHKSLEESTFVRLDEMVRIVNSDGSPCRKTRLELIRAMRSGSNWKGDLYLKTEASPSKKDQNLSTSDLYTSLVAGPLFGDKGVLLGYFGVFICNQDKLTENRKRRDQYEQLAQGQRVSTAERVAGYLAHEVNQPLGAISNYVGGLMLAIEHASISPKEIRDTLAKVQLQTIRASQVIKRFQQLMLSGLAQKEPVELLSLILTTTSLLDQELDVNRIHLSTRKCRSECHVMGDAVQLQQILMNLLTNAIESLKFAKSENRKIDLSLACDKNYAIVEVADNGVGVSESRMPKLFEPGDSTKEGGMGLGLSICRELAEWHGGSVDARNRHPRGFCVSIRLPIWNGH